MKNAALQAALAKHDGALPVQFLDVGSDADTIAYVTVRVEAGTVSSGSGPEKKVLYIEGRPA